MATPTDLGDDLSELECVGMGPPSRMGYPGPRS
jgi:hypothetical protein